ncbi:hypothetical protein OG203_32625 [Nocardia sp. NBC_01499]|uniref:hypothetical protein n=1 Tax=Nocardia sp. NBC_01499 TaxID=2903597 RepID=UPI003863E1F1
MENHELFELGHIGHTVMEHRANWLRPVLFFLGLTIVVAVIAMVVVSNANFHSDPAKVPPTHGSCEPFCTAPPAPPAPGQ